MSDLVHRIVSFDIDIEEEIPEDPLAYRRATGAPSEATEEQLTEQEAGMKQEETKEEDVIVNIKQEVLDEPEDRESVEYNGSGWSLARRLYIYRHQQRVNGASRSTRENAEEKKDGKDTPKRKADNEAGEGGSGEGKSGEGTSGDGTSGDGTSGEGTSSDGTGSEGTSSEGTSGESTSGDGPSEEKKAKKEEPSDAENDENNSNSNGNKSSSDCLFVYD